MLISGWSAALIKLEHSSRAFSTLSGDDKFAAALVLDAWLKTDSRCCFPCTVLLFLGYQKSCC